MEIIKNILILRLSSLGDILLSTPLIKNLRKKFPNARIDYVVRKEFADVLRYNPHISNLYIFDAANGFQGLLELKRNFKKVGYDLILDIHNNIRSKILRFGMKGIVKRVNKRVVTRWVLINLKLNIYRSIVPVPIRYLNTVREFQVEIDNEGLEIYIPKDARETVRAVLSDLGSGIVIGICPTAKHNTKRWLEERFAEVAFRLHEIYGAKILLFGAANERNECAEIEEKILRRSGRIVYNCAGLFTIVETAAAMDLCNLIISNDSGLMHVASALKKKVVAIFGPTVREFGFFPYNTTSIVLEHVSLKCRPCSHVGLDKCPKKHFRCMREITVEQVLDASRALLHEK
ncbi:MAG: lipopolysaccharide heptosyltransferase II [Bacteroidetes bacterium]|nr:lipopolysaccharide heptosyltransferase II [Bacteroidota bacterium]